MRLLIPLNVCMSPALAANGLISLIAHAETLVHTLIIAPESIHVSLVCDSARAFSDSLIYKDYSTLPEWPTLQEHAAFLYDHCLQVLVGLTQSEQHTTAVNQPSPTVASFSHTADFVRESLAILASRHEKNVHESWKRHRQRATIQSALTVEQRLDAFAFHWIPNQLLVVPAVITQFVQSLPVDFGSLWISAAVFDLIHTVSALAAQDLPAAAFLSHVPSLIVKRDQLHISARTSLKIKETAEPVMRALVLHKFDTCVPRISMPPELYHPDTPKHALAQVIDLLEAARSIRSLALTVNSRVVLETLRASLVLGTLKVPWGYKRLWINFWRYSILGRDLDSFFTHVRSLIEQDLDQIDRMIAACPQVPDF